MNDARTLTSPNIFILLVGNKRDLEEARAVTFLEGSNFEQKKELDPERTDSGIQYADAVLLNIQLKQRNSSRASPSDCRFGL